MIISLLSLFICLITAFVVFMMWKEIKEIHMEQKEAKDKEYLRNMSETLDAIKQSLGQTESQTQRTAQSKDKMPVLPSRQEYQKKSLEHQDVVKKESYDDERFPVHLPESDTFTFVDIQKPDVLLQETGEPVQKDVDTGFLSLINECLASGRFDLDGTGYRLIDTIEIKNSEEISSRRERVVFVREKNSIIGVVCRDLDSDYDRIYYAVPMRSFIQKSQALASAFKYLYQMRDSEGNYVPGREMEIIRLDKLAEIRFDIQRQEYQLKDGEMGRAIVK